MTSAADTTPRPAGATAISPTALILLAAWLASGAALWLTDALRGPLTFAFVLIGWLLSVMAHEFGHAITAYAGGDHTVAEKGYLTFDPLRYLDSVTSVLIPLIVLALGGIGLPGGAVYLRLDLIRSRLWRSAASLAGPAATLVVLLVLTAGLALLHRVVPDRQGLSAAVAFLAFVQATALIINLLPIPGFDGYGVLRPFLPPALAAPLGRVEPVIFLGFIALLFVSSGVAGALFGAAADLAGAIGVPRDQVVAGYGAFRFWK
jgi:Zn-dependent protease